jgi:3-methyladenine DNA glycosylase AlkD
MVATAHTPTPALVADELLTELRSHASADNVAGMARFGISSAGTLGVAMPVMRALARDGRKRLGKDPAAHHELAALLWASGVHEARIMAALADQPALVTPEQADAWAADLDSWDVCDQLCIALLRRCDCAWLKAAEWTRAQPEFVKRAGFSLGATLAVHDKTAPDDSFITLLDCAVRECTDERNMVKKALNWQVRSIGKRSAALNAAAITAAEQMLAGHPTDRTARWIARDALRELRSDAVRERLGISE